MNLHREAKPLRIHVSTLLQLMRSLFFFIKGMAVTANAMSENFAILEITDGHMSLTDTALMWANGP